MIEPAEQQATLIPERPPDTAIEIVDVALIDFEDIGEAPSAALKRAIKEQGILTPLTLARTATGRLHLVAGRRRLRVAKEMGLKVVPALVIEDDGMVNVSGLTDHATRRDNPAADLAHIEALVHRGASHAEISRATGLPVNAIKARLKLARLVPALRSHFDSGRIGTSVAEDCARLPAVTQEELAGRFATVGRLTQDDIRQARQARQQTAPSTMQLEGFDAPDIDPAAAPQLPTARPMLTDELAGLCRELVALFTMERRTELAARLTDALERAGVAEAA